MLTDFVLSIVMYHLCMPAPRQLSFAELDGALGSVLRRPADDPTKFALAVITRSLSLGIRPSTTRAFCSSRLASTHHALPLFSHDRSWSRLLSVCQAWLRRTSLPAGRRSLAVATSRRLVGLVVSSLPPSPVDSTGHPLPAISPRLEVSVRYLTAVIGTGILRDVKAKPGDPGASSAAGFDAVALVSASRLAVRSGQQRQAVSRQLALAAGPAGMLSLVSAAPGNSSRYRLHQLGPKGREAIENHFDAVGLLAGIPAADLALNPDPDDGAAGLFEAADLPTVSGPGSEPALAVELLQNCGHPAFSYDLGGPVFLVAFFDALGVEPGTLGISKRTASTARKMLAELGLVRGCAAADVRGILSARAASSGAFDRAREAETARKAAAAARTEAVLTARATRKEAAPDVRKLLGKMLAMAGPVPVDPAAARDWAKAMRHLYGQAAVPDAMHDAVRAQLRTKLTAAGWDASTARAGALRIAVKPAA